MEKFITPNKQSYQAQSLSNINTPFNEHYIHHSLSQNHSNILSLSANFNNQRDGDWICNNCNNLNYSFRKKCNRCKTQTRHNNTPHSVYSYYYCIQDPLKTNINIVNQNQIKNQFQSVQNIYSKRQQIEDFPYPSLNQKDQQSIYEKNGKQNTKFYLQKTPPKKNKPISINTLGTPQLPSVSPLLKKYKQSRQKNIRTTIGDRKANNKNLGQIPFNMFDLQYFDSEIENQNIFQDRNRSFSSQHQNYIKNVFVRDFDEILNENDIMINTQRIQNNEQQIQRLIENLIIE